MNLKLLIQLSIGAIATTVSAGAFAQVGYVEQDVIKIPGILTEAATVGLPVTQMSTTRMYYDGLGRPLQTVAWQASPAGKDMIQPTAYNSLGQQTIKYLPYTGGTTNASYHANALTPGSSEQSAFYNQTGQYLIPVDAAPYSQVVMENSPLQRMLESGMVGAGFQPVGGTGTQHYKTVSYRSNTSADGNIIIWNPDGSTGGYYAPQTLSVVDGTDEDHVETLSFSDYAGRTILKRQVNTGGTPAYYDTYYVYNNAGMVSIIISPKALAVAAANSYNLTVTAVANLLFRYSYDTQGRVISKTVPGKGSMSIIYDPLNRPVLMQDANLAALNQWNYIKYDVKSRAISQGIYTDATHIGQAAMQNYVSTLDYSTVYYEIRSTNASTGYYTNATFPSAAISALAYSYFDNYDLNDDGTNDYSYHTTGLPNEVGATTAPTKDMPTMTLLSTVGTGMPTAKWLIKVIFYDHNLHPIQTQSNNLINYTANTVTDYTTTVPDFLGQSTVSQTVKNVGTTTTVQTTPTYDPQYRVLAIDQQLNNSKINRRIGEYHYSEAGQMVQKGLAVNSGTTDLTLSTANSVPSGSGSLQTATNSITITPNFTASAGSTFVAQIAPQYLQQMDFRYNIRGQLVNINNSQLTADGGQTEESNNSVFGMQLLYDGTDANLATTPYYNGKLSAVKWMTKDGSGNNGYERAFVYNYDATDRYTKAAYAERNGTGAFGANDHWTEAITAYDENGNILGLTRNASTAGSGSYTAIDNLTYTYKANNANQLDQVTDATGQLAGFGIYAGGNPGGHYGYDANGNLTSDPFKNISTMFNVLNKTDVITMNAVAGQNIAYIYDASGNMIRKIATAGTGGAITTTDYIDGFVYVNSTLSYFPMPEGRMVNENGHLKPEYVVTDQQGNARITFDNTGPGNTAKVIQENSYYGFGMVMPGSAVTSLPTPPNKNLYNGGSEIQNDFNNLPDLMQTFYRNYDAALGRWTGVDPQAENGTESLSVYQYAGNNPIMGNDPLGNKVISEPIIVPYNEFQADQDAFQRQQFLETFGYTPSMGGGPGGSAPGGGGGFGSYASNPDPIGVWGDQHVQAAAIANYIDNNGGSIPGFGGSTMNGVLNAMNNSSNLVGFNLDWNTGNFLDDNGSLSKHEFVLFSEGGENEGGGPYFPTTLIGHQETVKAGAEVEFADGILLDKYKFAVFNSKTISGTNGLINISHESFTTFERTTFSSSIDLNLYIAKIKFLTTGVALQAGPENFNLTAGLSLEDGLMFGGEVSGHGFEGSARPGIGTAAAVIIGTLLAPVLAF